MRRYHHHPDFHRHRKGDKLTFGLIIILVGTFLLLKKLHIIPFFDWHTFWPLILICIGLLIGVRKRFQHNAWWILVLIGTAYSIPEFMIMGTSSATLMFPIALIIGGLFVVFRSRKKNDWKQGMEVVTNGENYLNIDVTFGGHKEIVTSKDFRGGNVNTTFGGVEVNMIQADSSTQPMVLNLSVSFGGVELIIPSHWELQNEVHSTMGSVEDHRAIRTSSITTEEKKILVLKGSCSFGSIEIKSY